MFMDEKNHGNNKENPMVNKPEGKKEDIADSSLIENQLGEENLLEPRVALSASSEVVASNKFNLLPYFSVVIGILVIGVVLIFILEKQDRISTGLFTGIIDNIEARETVGKVNGVEILRKDFNSSLNQFNDYQASQGVNVSDPIIQQQIQNHVIETLINDELLRQEALARGLIVENTQIDEEFNKIRDKLGGAKSLEDRMVKFGINETSLRREIENRFLILQLFEANLPATTTIEVNEEEINAIYNQAASSGQELPPLESVREQIVDGVRSEKEQQAITEYINNLRAGAVIEVLL